MITQNPIIGRSRNKLAGVYARTLYGKNVLQSCPTPTKKPPTPALQASRAAFGKISHMANLLPASLLLSLFYAAPAGCSRRQFLCSQLSKAVQRDGDAVSYSPTSILQLGSNPYVCQNYLTVHVESSTLQIDVADLDATSYAITTDLPTILALNFALDYFYDWTGYAAMSEGIITLQNLSSTVIGQDVSIFPLWKTNIGTTNTPIIVPGAYQKAQ